MLKGANSNCSFAQPAGGQAATIRGSGFQTGAVVTIGGCQLSTTFADENTLTVQLPAFPSGWQDVTVKNSNGDFYFAPGLFRVLPVQPRPVITGFSPASVTVSLSEYPLPITIVGSGFEGYDTVEINGQPIDSGLVDFSQIQATIPYWFGPDSNLPTRCMGWPKWLHLKRNSRLLRCTCRQCLFRLSCFCLHFRQWRAYNHYRHRNGKIHSVGSVHSSWLAVCLQLANCRALTPFDPLQTSTPFRSCDRSRVLVLRLWQRGLRINSPTSTPAGTYYLTVSATAGSAQTSYLLTLNVQ